MTDPRLARKLEGMRIGRIGFAAIGGLVVFGGLALAAAKGVAALTLRSAEGTVTQLGESPDELFPHWCVVSYIADGRRMEHRAMTYFYSPCVRNGQVKVLYDPNSPSDVRIAAFDSEWAAAIAILLIGGAILFAGQWMYGWDDL